VLNQSTLVLSPDLNLSFRDLEAAWAEDPKATETASIVSEDKLENFDLDALSVAAVVSLTTIAVGVSKDIMVHLIKRALERADKKKKTKEEQEIEVVQIPDTETGLPLFIARRKNSD